MTPDRGGSVLYDGTEVTALGDSALSRFRNLNIGFVFQFHRLLPEFTLIENVAMPALIAGVAREEAFDRARRLLERLNLKGRDGHKPSELSGGECQRGAVARALINKPKIILADEPSGSLDSQTGHGCIASSSNFAMNSIQDLQLSLTTRVLPPTPMS